eukprot:CAMPEP_0185553672 /NCGR_PEP_ID=MMETSP1381-20130426/38720_1 /TAXON_ID=298111 /ORGANISM="Pavlova sp., Strain CCMP459" /LENGTH=43 /DNA_ID= /DNA_START= /DNA_END= /DNA_ORIENTATION=
MRKVCEGERAVGTSDLQLVVVLALPLRACATADLPWAPPGAAA